MPEPRPGCTVDGCELPVRSLGLCAAHYMRLRRYGDATGGIRSPEQRFWAKVDRNGPISEHAPHLGPCWVWIAAAHESRGYGRFRVGPAERVLAHCFAYGLLVGPIPDGLELDHLCRNTLCVNPAHLEPVTHKENVDRGASLQAINGRKTHCDYGHPFNEENTVIGGDGGRRCRICIRRIQAAYRARKRRAAA